MHLRIYCVVAYCGYQLYAKIPPLRDARRETAAHIRTAEQNVRAVGTEAALCDSSMPRRLAHEVRGGSFWLDRREQSERLAVRAERLEGTSNIICQILADSGDSQKLLRNHDGIQGSRIVGRYLEDLTQLVSDSYHDAHDPANIRQIRAAIQMESGTRIAIETRMPDFSSQRNMTEQDALTRHEVSLAVKHVDWLTIAYCDSQSDGVVLHPGRIEDTQRINELVFTDRFLICFDVGTNTHVYPPEAFPGVYSFDEELNGLIGSSLLQTGWRNALLQRYNRQLQQGNPQGNWYGRVYDEVAAQILRLEGRYCDFGSHCNGPPEALARLRTLIHSLHWLETQGMYHTQRNNSLYSKIFILQATTDRLSGTSVQLAEQRHVLLSHYTAIPEANRTLDDTQSLAQLQSSGGTLLIGTPRMLVQWRMILLAHYRTQLQQHQLQISQYEASELARLRDAARGEYAHELRSVANDTLTLARGIDSTLRAEEKDVALHFGLLPLATLAASFAGVKYLSRKKKEEPQDA